MSGIADIILTAAGWTFIFWALYLVVMRAKKLRDAGTLHGWRLYVAYALAGVAFIIDIVYNLTLGNVVFFAFPRNLTWNPTSWTFTARLKYWIIAEGGWRTKLAAFICQYLLNPFAPGGKHCD